MGEDRGFGGWLQQIRNMHVILNGLGTGLLVALLASAFTVVYQPSRVFHLALAGIYTAVPYVAWTTTKNGLALPLAVTLAVTFGIIASLLCDYLNHRPLRRKGASEAAHFVSSLGISIAMVQIVALLFGNESQVLRTGVNKTITFAGAMLTHTQIVSALVAASFLIGYAVWLRLTGFGLQLRALANNPVEVALKGYSARRLHLLAFGISGALGSVAALLASYDLGFDPHGGLSALLLAIVAMIIGGRQSFLGPILGGIILGIVRSSVVWYWSAKWQDAVTFFLLAVGLLLFPNGILSRKTRLEATPS